MDVAITKPVYLTEEEAQRCGVLDEWRAIPEDVLILSAAQLEERVHRLHDELRRERRLTGSTAAKIALGLFLGAMLMGLAAVVSVVVAHFG